METTGHEDDAVAAFEALSNPLTYGGAERPAIACCPFALDEPSSSVEHHAHDVVDVLVRF